MNTIPDNLELFDNFESASRATLAYLHAHLGFKLWMVTRTVGDDWIVLHTDNHGYDVEEGTILRWSDSFCSRMVVGLGPMIAPVASNIPAYAEAPIGQQVPIGSYIGVPIQKEDGTLFGTLCAIDPEQKPEAIVEQLPLIELLARMLATILAAEHMAQQQAEIAEQAHRAEQALKKERWRLDNILKGTNVGSWEWNVQTGETVFNERWADIIGYTLEEISPVSIETWMNYAHPDDMAGSNEKLQQHFNRELDYYEFESRMRHKDGHWIWVLDRGRVFSWTEDGKPLMMFGTHQDITDRKLAEDALRDSEEKFRQLSTHDGLTGLLNRRGWEESLAAEEARSKRYSYQSFVAVLDLDDLKKVNDKYGHKEGDNLICRAAQCIQGAVREVDIVARLGGDEFAVAGIECDEENAQIILQRISNTLSSQRINASWGMAMCSGAPSFAAAILEADRLMYKMKATRRVQRSDPTA